MRMDTKTGRFTREKTRKLTAFAERLVIVQGTKIIT